MISFEIFQKKYYIYLFIMELDRLFFFENSKCPKGCRIANMKKYAYDYNIALPPRATKDMIFATIKDSIMEDGLEEESSEDELPDVTKYLGNIPKSLTLKTMRDDAVLLNIKLSPKTTKPKAFAAIKKIISTRAREEEHSDIEEEITVNLSREIDIPTITDMVKLVDDLEKGKKDLTGREMLNILNELKRLGFQNCGVWYKISSEHFIGAGVSGSVYKIDDRVAKTVLFKSKSVDQYNKVIIVEYDYISVVFSAIVNNIVNRGMTPNLIVIKHIYKCESNKIRDIHNPKDDYILYIMDYVACGSLFNLRRSGHKFSLNQKISIFLQIFSTIMILAKNKIGHFDLHENNILICETDLKSIDYQDFNVSIPLYGYIVKIIDYDFVGVATDKRAFYNTPGNRSTVFLSEPSFIKKYPIAFILSQIYLLRNIDKGMVQETGELRMSPIYSFCERINSLSPEERKHAVIGGGYEKYADIYDICLRVYDNTVIDLLKKIRL